MTLQDKHLFPVAGAMALATLLPVRAMAETVAAEPDSLRSTMLNPVVVTGTGTYHRAATSPVSVRVVSAKELQDAHASSLQEALTRLTPNVTTHTNGMGTFVNFGGVSDDYVVILVNGQRVSGDDRWERISLDNVRRIEIYNSAASALYGSDAMAGVINIITDDARKLVSASSTTKVMDHGRLSQDINVDVNTRKFSSRTSYTHRQADNWQVSHYQEFDEGDTKVLKLTGRPMSAGFHSDNISQRLEWRFNDRWSMYLRGDYYDNLTTRPQTASYFTQKKQTDKATGETTYSYTSKQAYTYDLHHRSYAYGAGARFTPNPRIHLYLDIYSDNFSSDYDYWQTAEKEAYDETRKRTHYVNETLRGIFRLAAWNKLTAGAEFVQERLTSQSDNIDKATTNTYNLFAQDEVNIVRGLDAFAGVRFTHNDNFGSAVTPNVGLFYHLDFANGASAGGSTLRLRASYAGGYRTPTLSQLHATDQAKTTSRYTLPNTRLQPEKNHFVNVSAEFGTSWMNVSVGAFWNKIRDMINYRTMTTAEVDADPALAALKADGWTTIRQRDNIDRATLRGITT
ncbi:MAG: TonB-dependent receptor, partial [Bacteroidaceae bacterium]|nr:TonB-dependent receptor [Bacteroidaceae bacterium]